MAGSATILFGARYTADADWIQEPAGEPYFFDTTRVTVTKNVGDAFYVSGSPESLAVWICDDRLYVETSNSGPVGFSGTIDGALPECVPIERVLAPVEARDVTSLIPEGTSCVTFRLADTQRQILGNTAIYLIKTSTVDVDTQPLTMRDLVLLAPSPNPTSAHTTLSGELPASRRVRIVVLDLHGRIVRTIANDDELGPGRWSLSWDGRDASGVLVPPGIYLARFTTAGVYATRRFAVIR